MRSASVVVCVVFALPQRSLRIAKLEGEAQRKAVEAELQKEKEQQMVLHGRIASLLKKVEYMDKRRSEAEEKLAATKTAARAAKTDKTGGNLQHLSEINAKDKEISSLKKALKGTKAQGTPKKLASQVKSLESKLQKAQDENAKLKQDGAAAQSSSGESSAGAEVRR